MSENVTLQYWLPVEHSMLRRNQKNNYHRGDKAYMVTLRIEDMCPLLGEIVPTAPSCDATPRIAECRLTPLGEAMRQAWLSLPQRFHNISIIDSPEEYVIMPEHFHGIIYVTGYMEEHLGEVVRLFKARVAMSYRKLLIQGDNATNNAPTNNITNKPTNNITNKPTNNITNTPTNNITNAPTYIPAVGTAKEWLRAYRALAPAQQAATRQWVEEQLALLYSATRCGTQGNGGQANSGQANGGVANGGQANGGQANGGKANGGQANSGQANGGKANTGAAAPPIRVVASGKHSKVGFLFGTGYNDSLLLDEENLEGHRRYIYENPKSRWMRTHNRQLLRANRNGIDTAVTITALEGYLRRECPASAVSDGKLGSIRSLLLYSATRCGTQGKQGTTLAASTQAAGTQGKQGTAQAAGTQVASTLAAGTQGKQGTTLVAGTHGKQGTTQAAGKQVAGGVIVCQSYGDRALLERRMLPVVCHRKDAACFEQQKARCLQEAAGGAIMVSACISPKEREIMQAVMEAGYPVVRIIDNGFPELYHPSRDDIELCATSKLLIVTPWQYHYRHKDEAIYVAYCKTMNCIAQALCRTKDSWWRG